MLGGLLGIAMAILTRGLKIPREEIELPLVDVGKDLGDKRIHAYVPI